MFMPMIWSGNSDDFFDDFNKSWDEFDRAANRFFGNGELMPAENRAMKTDVIEEDNLEIKAYEIKASETMNTAFFSNIKKIKEIAGLKAENTAVIYSGKSLPATSENGAYICWKEI